MPVDTTSVIEKSLTDAGVTLGAEDSAPDTSAATEPSSTPSGDDGGSTADGTPAAASPSGAPPAEPATAPAPDEVDQALMDMGITPKDQRGRESRVPHSRLKEMVAKSWTKNREANEVERKKMQAELSAAQERAKLLADLDALATSNPRQYMELLARANPAYQQFLAPAAPVPAPIPPEQADPMPQPDAQFPDGSTGYSPQQHMKLLEWNGRQVERRVNAKWEKEMNSRFGPVVREFEGRQALEAERPAARARIAAVKETWGDLFTKNEQEIHAAMQANPRANFEALVAKVLLPKVSAERTSIRAEVLAELKARPAAAAQSAPVAAKSESRESHGPRDLTDAIKEAIAPFR